VSDTGPGIPPEDLHRVFERYWQSDRTARHGAGLGLPIAKGIVEAHGGRIRVESALGVGTAFEFCLPRVLARPVAKTTGTEDASHAASAVDSVGRG
jgi:signal transduction histidine kinase